MKHLIFSFLLLFPFFTFAQTIEFIEPRSVQNYDIVDFTPIKTKTNMYVLMDKFTMRGAINRNVQMDVYNSNFKNTASNLLEDGHLAPGDANIFEGFHVIDDKLYLFKSHYVREENKYALNYYPVSENAVRGAGVELTSFPSEKIMNSGNFYVVVSDDGSKIAVFGEMPFERKENEKCKIWVYDRNFNEIWSREYEFSYESMRGPRNDLMVNNDGDVFILKRVRVRKELDFQSVFSFLNKGKDVNEYTIDKEFNLIISSYKHSFADNKDLILTGFYYEDKKFGINVSTPSGLLYLRISGNDGSLVTHTTSDIERNENLTIINVLHTNEGNFYVIGEQFNEKSTPINAGTTPIQYDYEYNNEGIYVYYLDGNGEILWNQKINRKIKSKNDNAKTSQIFAWESKGRLNLLFRDLLHKYDGTDRIVVGPGKTNVYANIIMKFDTESGDHSAKFIEDERIGKKRGEYVFIPSTGFKIDDNTIWMLAARWDRGKSELVSVKISY